MLEKIIFKNHMGETIDFGEGGLYLNNNELRSYKWNYSSKNNRISYFSRDVQEKKLPIVVVPDVRDTGNNIMNRLMELADRDIIAKLPGRIIAGDYYLDCYLFASENSRYDLKDGVFYADLTVVTDKPSWIRETTQVFNNQSGGDGFLDYPYDHPYDFTSPSKIRRLENLGFWDSDFKLIIYGEVTDPNSMSSSPVMSIPFRAMWARGNISRLIAVRRRLCWCAITAIVSTGSAIVTRKAISFRRCHREYRRYHGRAHIALMSCCLRSEVSRNGFNLR